MAEDGHPSTYDERHWAHECRECGRRIRYGMYCSDSDVQCGTSPGVNTQDQEVKDEN